MLKPIISLQTERKKYKQRGREEEEPLQEKIVRHEDQSVQPLDISQISTPKWKKNKHCNKKNRRDQTNPTNLSKSVVDDCHTLCILFNKQISQTPNDGLIVNQS